MKKSLTFLVAFVIMLFPMMVNADEITTVGTPEYISEKDTLVAKGTPIVIEERDGVTYATWEEEGETKEQALTVNSVVIGGYYNTFTSGTNHVIDIESTSITMNSGEIWGIVGGNAVDSNIAGYDKIHVGTINITMNGGTLDEISGVSTAKTGIINTAVPADKYASIEEFYYVDNINVNVNNANITMRMYFTSSYTYAGNVTVNVSNSNIGSAGIGTTVGGEFQTFAYSSLSAGTNGKVGKFVVNIADSEVDQLDAGLRAMVDEMEFNVTGESVIGNIYAGSAYAELSKSNNTEGAWSRYSWIPYGQAGSIEINIGKGVTYNNIYAGFQFATLNGVSEYDTFYSMFGTDSTVQKVAMGLANAKSANVAITLAETPTVTDSNLESMLDGSRDNVTVNYVTVVDAPVVDLTTPVEVPTFGVTNADSLNALLDLSASENTAVLEAVANGDEVATAIEVNEITEVDPEIVALVTAAINAQAGTATVVGYYDISILLKNVTQGTDIGNITELSEPIELVVALPEALQSVPEGYNRVFYIVREHNGEVELINTNLSEDGKTLTFATDKFSTYALTYVDNEIVENPGTLDNAMTYMVIGIVSLIGIAGISIYLKKHN